MVNWVSVQSFPRLQITEGSDVRERQGHAELAFVAQRPEVKSPVFDINPETPKIIAELTNHLLGYLLRKIVIEPERAAQAFAVHVAIGRNGAQQVERR